MTEDDSIPSNHAEATVKLEELPAFSINDLLSLPWETNNTLIDILKDDDV